MRTQGVETEAGDDSHRVYVSRADATTRRVHNFEEIRSVLNHRGFETYVLGNLTVAEQIRIFANADTVVAPHGAGLTNVVYSDDLSVIELFGDKEMATFARLAKMLDHDYTPVDCEQRGVNLVVDPQRLDAVLEDVLKT
jgi:capsular polysaccharide biosynthesis protein